MESIECCYCGNEFDPDLIAWEDPGPLCPDCEDEYLRENELFEQARYHLQETMNCYEELGLHPCDEILYHLYHLYPKYDYVNTAFNLRRT